MIKFLKRLFKRPSRADRMRDNPEPWINVVKAHIDPKDPKQGYFELEWNPAFVKHLIEAGYYGPNPESIVDQWFTELCRNISLDQNADVDFIADAGRAETRAKTKRQK